jgi:hypothetical protein
MKKLLILSLLVFFCLSPEVLSQSRPAAPPMDGGAKPFTSLRERMLSHQTGWDIGLSFGTAHSLADIGGTRDQSRILFFDTQWKATGLHVGVFGRYRFNELFALTTEFNYGKIGGADSLSPETSSRYNRAYYFENHLYEMAFKGEVYLPKYYLDVPFDLYAYVGFGLFYHDPDLAVTNPETFQAGSFSHVQPAIPMGIGLHYTLPNNFRIGYNIGWRKTFTDHLDGLSTRSSRGNDSYFFNAFNIGYYFRVKQY